MYSGFSRLLIACYTHFSAACCWLRSSCKRESLAGKTEGAREARIDTRHPLGFHVFHYVESCCFLRQYNVQCMYIGNMYNALHCIVGINTKYKKYCLQYIFCYFVSICRIDHIFKTKPPLVRSEKRTLHESR